MIIFITLLITIVLTIIITRHYYLKSTNKSLGVYEILDTNIFSDIEEEIRKQLKFTFCGKEVNNLRQIKLIVANDGERSISNIIEPLNYELPADTRLLDVTILDRHPESLKVDIKKDEKPNGTTYLVFDFPLLNKGDFFLIKLLLDGPAQTKETTFHITADDLPHKIKVKWLSLDELRRDKTGSHWSLIATGFIVSAIPTWIIWIIYSLYKIRPELSPYPWSTFSITWESIIILIPGLIICSSLAFIAILFIEIGRSTGFSEQSSKWRTRLWKR